MAISLWLRYRGFDRDRVESVPISSFFLFSPGHTQTISLTFSFSLRAISLSLSLSFSPYHPLSLFSLSLFLSLSHSLALSLSLSFFVGVILRLALPLLGVLIKVSITFFIKDIFVLNKHHLIYSLSDSPFFLHIFPT